MRSYNLAMRAICDVSMQAGILQLRGRFLQARRELAAIACRLMGQSGSRKPSLLALISGGVAYCARQAVWRLDAIRIPSTRHPASVGRLRPSPAQRNEAQLRFTLRSPSGPDGRVGHLAGTPCAFRAQWNYISGRDSSTSRGDGGRVGRRSCLRKRTSDGERDRADSGFCAYASYR